MYRVRKVYMGRKGFTLIELLAVIVILAVLIVVAVPKILDIIENSKKSAAKSSAELYIDSIEKNIAIANVDSNVTKIVDGTYNITTLSVNIKGNKPTNGEIIIEKGKVVSAEFCINEYKVKFDNRNVKIIGLCDTVEIEASDVKFTPSDSNWQVSTVEEALNELYK